MVIKVGRLFLKKIYNIVLADLNVPRKDFAWYIDQFEDCFISEEGVLQLGDGDNGYFVEGIGEISDEVYDEFTIEVVEGRDIVLELDFGEEDGEDLEDSFYDFIYETMEKYFEEK